MAYAKSILAAIIAGLSSLIVGLSDDTLDTAEWLTAAVATLVALGAVYAVPNKPSEPPPPGGTT